MTNLKLANNEMTCPAVEMMLKEAGFGNGKSMEATGKYNTVGKRTKLVKDMMKIAKENVTDFDKFSISTGNAKMSDIYSFALPPIVTCPNATKSCILKCYGLKNWYMNYQNVADAQYRNFEMTKQEDFEMKMYTQLAKLSAEAKAMNDAFGSDLRITFRIHTVGDFYSQEYFNSWMKITDLAKQNNLPIDFGAYTKAFKFLKTHLEETDRKLSDLNINFMASVWADTKQKDLDIIEELGMNMFLVTKDNLQQLEEIGFEKCADDILKGACGKVCRKCYIADEGVKPQLDGTNRKLIAIKLH